MGNTVNLINSSSAPASERVLVEALLAHANGAAVTLNGVAPRDSNRTRARIISMLELVREANGREPEARTEGGPFREIFDYLSKEVIGQLRIHQAVEVGARGLTLGYFREFPTVDAALGFAVLLMLEQRTGYGKALCRCHLDRCRNFYLARKNPRGGPANRTYCSPAHREESHDSSQSRIARKRARKPRKLK